MAPDPDRCPTFQCGPVRSGAGDVEVRDGRPVGARVPDGAQDDPEEVPSLHHRLLRARAPARHPCGSFYH